MLYPVFLVAHLFAALIFIGTVFFRGADPGAPAPAIAGAGDGVGGAGRRPACPGIAMPWVLLVLFGAGLGMVWLRYLPVLAAPSASAFGTLLTLKLILAASVLLHFLLTIGAHALGLGECALCPLGASEPVRAHGRHCAAGQGHVLPELVDGRAATLMHIKACGPSAPDNAPPPPEPESVMRTLFIPLAFVTIKACWTWLAKRTPVASMPVSAPLTCCAPCATAASASGPWH